MRPCKVKVIGGRAASRLPLRGSDIRVIVETPEGEELLVPALSFVLRCGSRHEQAVLTVEVPAVLVDVNGVQLETTAVVDSKGPESQFEEALGKDLGTPIADVEHYAEPNRELISIGYVQPGHDPNVAVDAMVKAMKEYKTQADPMAELDALIAAGGDVATLPGAAGEGVEVHDPNASVTLVRPMGPTDAFEAANSTTLTTMFADVLKDRP